MAGLQNVSFTNPYSAEEQDIQRRRQLAEMLQAKGMEPLGNTEMVGGWAIPKSPWEGLGKVAQQISGAYQQNQANEMAKALGERQRGDRTADMGKLAQMLKGAPASSEQIVDEQANGGIGAPATINAPAVAPQSLSQIDPSQFRSPQMQDMLMQQRIAQLTKGQKWEKAEMPQPDGSVKKGYVDLNSPNPDSTFRTMGTAPVKQEFVFGSPQNPYTATGPVMDPNALMIPDGKGGFKPNDPLVGIKKDIAAKGAANVQVKTDVKTGESLAGQVGPMMANSVATADGAVKQIDAARRIVQSVDTNKLFSGPMAETRMTLAQIAQTFGVGGKDDAEKIANTRQAMRGLAELTLQGRQQMKGQGAITESEGKLAERAMSGEINFTAAEIKQLAKATERVANFNLSEHQRKLKVMQGNPALQGIAPFYQGPAVPVAPGATQISPETRAWMKANGITPPE